MKKLRICYAFAALLLLQTIGVAQEADEQPPVQEGSTATGTAVAETAQAADSTVLVVPYPELVMQRLDTIVDDSLMETTQLGLMVWDLTDDTLLYERNARQLMRPASTMKVLTAVAALDRLGTSYKYTTSLYYKGTVAQGQLRGDLICRGGMDPLFSRADMLAFVRAVKGLGVTSLKGRIITDVSMKEAEKWGEGWCWDDDNPVLSPLLVDGKANFAAQLMKELRAAGVATGGATVVQGALPRDAKLITERSHAIEEVIKPMMKESDNLCAEATFYQLAASGGKRPATAKEGQRLERELLDKLGLDGDSYRLADGSGLSLYNYLSAEAQVMLLRYAWSHPETYTFLTSSLPIAGVDGTLKNRMKDTPAQGNVRAKTGTVTGLSSLSGFLNAPNGHRICFSIINQGVRRAADGRRFQDRICLALCQP